MKIYTRTGDRGETGLFGGKRLKKSELRLHAYGSIDELNAELGIILSHADLPDRIRRELSTTQHTLFIVGADLATPLESAAKLKRLEPSATREVEVWIDTLESHLPTLQKFIMPSGSRIGSELHFARTVCRRAERWTVTLAEQEAITQEVLVYLNRLSDYLFVAARYVNKQLHAHEKEVKLR